MSAKISHLVFILFTYFHLIQALNLNEDINLDQMISNEQDESLELFKIKNLKDKIFLKLKKKDSISEENFIQNVIKVLKSHVERNNLKINPNLIVGDGKRFIVFNCTNPTYLDENKNKILLKNTELNRNQDGIRSSVNGKKLLCDLPTNLWREEAITLRLITYNPKLNQFLHFFNEEDLKLLLRLDLIKLTQQQLKPLKQNLVVSILKTYHHPRYFY